MTITPNRADLAAYLSMIFDYVENGTCIALRGTGEKGTTGEGGFVEAVIAPAIASQFDVDRIFGHVQRWSQFGRASFLVPAAIDMMALEDKKATEDRILAFTTILVDIDTGDTKAKLAHAVKYLDRPTMIVHSGGTTDEGNPKIHAYWRFTEASDAVDKIAAARKLLAQKIGGDASFGRSTQVIRIPGSIYAKNGVQKSCMIVENTGYEYEASDLLRLIDEMPVMEGLPAPKQLALGTGLVFSPEQPLDRHKVLTSQVHEGAVDEYTRWDGFNKAAGGFIYQARRGDITGDEAEDMARNWMLAQMVPPWPEQRFRTEWQSLVAHDLRAKGPFAGPPVPLNQAMRQTGSDIIDVTPNGIGIHTAEPAKLAQWQVSDWSMGDRPKRRFLVDGLVMAGKSHMLAAEGGAGKTFLLLDLALKLSTHSPGDDNYWCGMPLTDIAGGAVVMFTTEDDKDELHIRLSEIDPYNRRAAAKDRLVIIPTINIGGAFPLVEREKSSGSARIGVEWGRWLDQLRAVAQLQPIKLVVIDTLNTTLHGEENNATVINEYVQAASAIVCGELGAALIVTHHVRKPGEKTKIYTPEDMKNSIRGSTALIGAFRVALGIWHAPDFKERLVKIGQEPKRGRLYNFAVVKANNPEMCFETRTMLRQPNGLLNDITDSEKRMAAATSGQAEAWLVHTVAHAAEVGHPFTIKGLKKKPPNGRKHQLPAMLQSLTERDMEDLAMALIDAGRVKQCNLPGTTTYAYLDVPDGGLARQIGQDGGVYAMEKGADFTPPSWDHIWAYHPVEQRIVKRGEEAARTLIPVQKDAASEARKPHGWNPNNDPDLVRQ